MDWSTLTIRAIFCEMDDGDKEFMVAYASKSNNNAKAQYNLYERECLAVVCTIAYS